jgi:hypothetical protein
MSRSKDIIFLLGAGASAEADIPVSSEMINRVEELLKKEDWRCYDLLYNHVKSAIYFAAGLKGQFHQDVVFNIETLVNTLYELEKNEEHPLYPFIAAWNSRFVALAGPGFGQVRHFRRQILAALKKWMCPEDGSKSNYYRGLITLQHDLTYPLHVFSLNYDLCVERLNQTEFRVETGFADYGPENAWEWERFEDSNNLAPHILLYKLHGSINWKRSSTTKRLFAVEQIETVDADQMEVIFGRDFKLEAGDPYLFFAYKFRDFTLLAKLIVTLGYGFGDEHINKILAQSLRTNAERRLFVVQKCQESGIDSTKVEVLRRLELNQDHEHQIVVEPGSAKQFLQIPDLAKRLATNIDQGNELPF